MARIEKVHTLASIMEDKRESSTMDRHLSCLLLLIGLMAGCTQPIRPPSVPEPPQAITRPASIQSGCLLPSPEAIDAANPGSVEMLIDVSEVGSAVKSTITRSSGVASRDSAFQRAAMECAFVPATAHTLATGERKPVAGNYRLAYSWSAGQKFLGSTRCFPSDYYPRAAQIRGEEADVQVHFRRSAIEGTFEFRVTSSTATQFLRQASLEAVQRCLVHPEAQVGLSVDNWYSVPFIWRLVPDAASAQRK